MMQSIQQTKRVYFLAIFLYWLSVAVSLPVFVLLMESRGFDLLQVGIIMGAYSLIIVLLELPTGGLADALGRKTVSLLAYSMMLISTCLILVSFSFAMLLLAIILAGAGRALSSGALDAWFVDSLKKLDADIDLQPPLAHAGAVTLMALGAGSIVGGFLPIWFNWLPARSTAVLTPLSTTQVVSAVLLICLLIVLVILVKEPGRRPLSAKSLLEGFNSVPGIIGDSLRLSRQNHTLIALFAASAAAGFALVGVESFWQPRFAELVFPNGDTWIFGLTMAVSFLAGMFGNLISVPLARRWNGRHAYVAILARGLQGAALIILALQNQLVPAAIAFWFFYMNMGMVNAPHATLLNEQIPSSRRSAMLSVESLASYIGGAVGGFVLGFLAQQLSVSFAWLVAGIISMVSLLFYISIARQPRRARAIVQS